MYPPIDSNSENRYCKRRFYRKSEGSGRKRSTLSIRRLFEALESARTHAGSLAKTRRRRAMNQGIDKIFRARPRTETRRRVDVPGVAEIHERAAELACEAHRLIEGHPRVGHGWQSAPTARQADAVRTPPRTEFVRAGRRDKQHPGHGVARQPLCDRVCGREATETVRGKNRPDRERSTLYPRRIAPTRRVEARPSRPASTRRDLGNCRSSHVCQCAPSLPCKPGTVTSRGGQADVLYELM